MSAASEGMAIARARIAEEKRLRTGFLDLGRLGLEEWPEELWELEHLTGLNLGDGWYGNGVRRWAASSIESNSLKSAEAQWGRLTNLVSLSVSGLSWNDLFSLAGLGTLRTLDCSRTQISSVEPLSGLSALKTLRCMSNQIGSLEPLSGLSALQTLDCSGNQISSLEPLSGVLSLQTLNCSDTGIASLEPLSGLRSLQTLHCSSTGIASLEPLSGVLSLQTLHCSNNRIASLEPLSGLRSLQTLHCSSTGIASLEPLSGLRSLQTLHCSDTGIASLEPLSGLRSLQTLHCSYTGIASLEPLSGLRSLQTLHCYNNRIARLEPLSGLMSLQTLNCSRNPLSGIPVALVERETLRKLVLWETGIRDIPAEVLSQEERSDCLEPLRAHFRDLRDGEAPLPDVKLMVLGNGRIGKTQICNRLRDRPFEKDSDSTHGITVASTDFGTDVRLRIWDFGGQDIYHGTHALFMRNRAVFLLVWTPESENSETHEHKGMTFRNRPLAWWLAYVRHLAGKENPVLVAQNRCDRPEEERLRPPVGEEVLNEFSFRKVLHYSALTQRGGKALEGALEEAVGWLREKQGQARIGKGRLAVKDALEAMIKADAEKEDASQRQHRTISMERYEEICRDCRGVSSPALLLDYLHQCGVLFYQRGLFGDRIILDQGWALEAVYAVFNREKCYRPLRQLHGRFTRWQLEALVWGGYSKAEQELFLSFMRSCGVCFIHRAGDEELGIETEYVAPDLLPEFAVVREEVAARWDGREDYEEEVMESEGLHPGVLRGLLSRIGERAGMNAIYWNEGVSFYERTMQSHARIERSHDAAGGGGGIRVRTHGGQSRQLLEELREWVRKAAVESGCREVSCRGGKLAESTPPRIRPVTAPDDLGEDAPVPVLEIAPAPRDKTTYAVSYAWREESVEAVERLCREAEARGMHILRDVEDLGMGEKISEFMGSIALRDRVFVILSDRYLRSENCMFELKEIWRRCQADEENFHRQVRVYKMPDTRIDDLDYQLDIIEYWVNQYEAVNQRVAGLAKKGKLSGPILRRYNLLNAFAEHAGEIVPYIADRLRPRDFEEFLRRGFED